MVSVEDRKLHGGGMQLKSAIWDAAKSTIEQWTGMEQKPTSMYGIRVYEDGAILSPHVDRLPLVSSCIVNVAQDVDEPWPLEVYDREGNAVNVTMEPGDMVLYESGSLLHGRPFALKGKYFANIFIHFEPTGRPLFDQTNDYLDEMHDFLPPYLIPDSAEAEKWSRDNPHGWNKPSPSASIQQANAPEGHQAAATGDVERLVKLAAKDRKALHFKDEHGWQPIHEAARAGNVNAIELLIKNGAQLNARTGPTDKGGSTLNVALDYLAATHALPRYLLSIGAENIEPEL
jgi:prolyl 4-hydroxylase